MCNTLAFIAQLVERCTCNAKVSGSIPDGGIFFIINVKYIDY